MPDVKRGGEIPGFGLPPFDKLVGSQVTQESGKCSLQGSGRLPGASEGKDARGAEGSQARMLGTLQLLK